MAWFFTPGSSDPYRKAKALCNDCSVRLECLDDAMAFEAGEATRYGVRGGLMGYERVALARRAS